MAINGDFYMATDNQLTAFPSVPLGIHARGITEPSDASATLAA
jgi:hypothetical protein